MAHLGPDVESASARSCVISSIFPQWMGQEDVPSRDYTRAKKEKIRVKR